MKWIGVDWIVLWSNLHIFPTWLLFLSELFLYLSHHMNSKKISGNFVLKNLT